MRVHCHPGTDSIVIHLRDGAKGIVGEIIGEDLNVVLHCDDAGTIYDFEVVGSASKVFDLERLEVEVLPVGVSPSAHRESNTG